MGTRLVCSLLGLLFATFAYGVTCTENDWTPLCDLPEWAGTRCVDLENFRFYCAAGTDGCDKIDTGCFGTTPVGHWYPVNVADVGVKWRCQCGCFASETLFTGPTDLNGVEIIAAKNDVHLLMTPDSLEFSSMTNREINGIMHAPQNTAWKIRVESGQEVLMSDSHPVVTADADGNLLAIKAAKNVTTEDYLLDMDGIPQAVELVEGNIPYKGEMMNFNVASENGENHFVAANGLWLGDSAWQEALYSIESRIIWRQDIYKYLEGKGEK